MQSAERARHSAMVSFAIPEEESPVGDVVDAYDLVERYEHRFWEARDCFSLYDPNGKGRISGGVVAEALARFGARPDGSGDDDWAAEVAIAMRECGCDANGTVNFNSFKRVWNHTKGLAEKDSRGAPESPIPRNRRIRRGDRPRNLSSSPVNLSNRRGVQGVREHRTRRPSQRDVHGGPSAAGSRDGRDRHRDRARFHPGENPGHRRFRRREARHAPPNGTQIRGQDHERHRERRR